MRLFPFARCSDRSLATAARPVARRIGKASRPRARLLLEALEDRRVPTAFVVNSLLDGSPVGDGNLTLREAITAATTNAPSGDAPAGSADAPDVITFASNLAFGTIALGPKTGGFVVNGGGDLRIVGPVAGNPGSVVINGQDVARVFEIDSGAGANAISLENLTLTRGIGQSAAGLLNAGRNVTLTSVAITNNNGLDNGGIYNTGTLTLNHCVVSGNSGSGPDQVNAGGILTEQHGVLSVNDSRIVGNSGRTGGISLNVGTMAIRGSTVADNTGLTYGGVLCSTGTTNIEDSTISGNRAAGGAGGIGVNSAIGTFNGAFVNVRNTTIADNISGRGSSSGGGGGIWIFYDHYGQVRVINCTIVQNADTSGSTDSAGGIGSSPDNDGAAVILQNTIVSLNSAAPGSSADNVDISILNTSDHNFLDGDPRLGALQDNGGPTLTMAPSAISPVINSGNNLADHLSHDQRGARRIIDGAQLGGNYIDIGAVEFSPGSIHPLVTGADAGSSPEVKVYDGLTGALRFDFLAFPASFLGGVRVATGDVTADGVDDIVVAAGPGGGPQVNVYNGVTGALVKAFFAYAPSFNGGVFVAVGDVNNDLFADVITGKDAGSGPAVAVFDGLNLTLNTKTLLASFLAYDPSFTGGVRLASGDVNGDGFADVIAGKGPGTAPRVKVFSGQGLSSSSQTLLYNFLAYASSFTGGVYVASGDTNGDGDADIITGAGAGGGPAVNVFSGLDGSVLASFFAYGVNFGGGVRVGAADLNGDGVADIITGRGPGGEPTVKVFDGQSLAQGLTALDRFDAYDLAFTGGVFVGGA